MELNQVLGALRNADAAGDVEAAKRLALIARTMTGQERPEAIMSTEELQNAKSAPTSLGDIARSFGSGVVGAGKSLVDVLGAGSDASNYLGRLNEDIQKGITPERQAEMARRAELSKRAEKEGLWSEIKSGIAGIAEAPLQSIAQGVGSSLPTIAAGLAALPLEAPALLGIGVQRAAQVLIAAAQGTGEVKGDIHDTIKQAYKDKGMDDAQAEKLAVEAQEYTLKNAPLLIGGAAFGALDALTGFEKSTSQALRNALTPEKKAFTKEGLQAAIKQLPEKAVQAPTYLGQGIKTGIEEAIPEGLQGGYGQLAQNVAMSQAGFETPTFQGVAGAAARDALVGALTGTAMSPLGHSVAHAEFEADKYLRGVKAEQELQTQREEFTKQQEQTKENLGVNKTLALGYEPKAEEEKYTNPAATITKEMLTQRGGPASQELKFVDEYRKQNGLPKLKAYSIEDIKDAMPGIDPEGEQGRIDSILAAVYGYKPVDDNTGKPVNYTPDDVISAAEHEKNIATGTKGFNDFLTRVTGSSDLNTMSQPQLFAAFQTIKQMPESEEKQILPEGTGASRFTDKQYKQAVSWFGQTFEQFDNKPLSRDTIIQDIQEATGLEQKHDAEALLDTAVKNGDLAETEEAVYRTYDDNGKLVSTYRDKAKADAAAKKKGLNVKEERLKQLTPPPAAEPAKRLNMPAGYEMTKETVKEGEIPEGFEIYPEGRGKALVTVPTEAELQAKVESLTGARKKEADKTLANMDRDVATLKRARENLESMEARGEVGSQAYELAKTRLAKQERILGKRIERHMDRIAAYNEPLKTRPTKAKKQVTREKITVTKGGKSLGSFPDNVKAQEAILVQMTDEELAATASDDRLGAIADRAALEIERRKQPAGIMVKRSPKPKEELPPLAPELQAAADEIAKKLVPILQRMGLGNVGLKIVESIRNGGEGSYTKNLIKLVMDAKEPQKIFETLHHESLHALKDLGFFTDQQWATLEKQADKTWIQKYLKNVRSEIVIDGEKQIMSRYDAYVYLNKTLPEEYNKANPDKPQKEVMSDKELNDLLREEAIADAFADFATTKPPGGMIASIMKRLNDLFKALKNAIMRSGFESAEDIFGKAQRGELKGVVNGKVRPNEPKEGPGARGNERERFSAGRAGERRGRLPGGSLAPLEGAPNIEGATGPDPRLVEVAKQYAKKAGIPFRPQAHYAYVYPEKAKLIAKAYDEMPHAPNDPRVREAYQDLINQTRAQYDSLIDAGYKFKFFDSNTDPYKGNPFNAMRDLRKNKEMAVYGTYDGFGTEGITAGAVDDNPLLQDTGLRWPDQEGKEHPVTANDLFRAVHDAFGHGLEGAGFRATGEENAWQAHARMYTGLARGAMTSETRGQNSWLNFGPYGEKNRNAKIEDTVFAEQKTGLMPEWTWNEGMVSDESGISLGKRQPDAQTYDGVHYGKQPSLNELSGKRYGEGLRGGEVKRLDRSDDPRIRNRVYFYIENTKGEMPTVESGLGANVYTQRFNNILGPGPAMSAISIASRGDSNVFESEVIDAGYDGYAVPSMGMMVILNNDAPVNYQGTRPQLQEKKSLKIVRDNEVPNLGKKVTVNVIGNYFDKSIMDAFGRKLSYQNAVDFDRALGQAEQEVRYQIEQEKSGLDWYDDDVKNAFKETAKLIPELSKKENRILFSVMAGIMSPQTNAKENWFIAAKNFQNYLSNGVISGVNPENGKLWMGGTQSANKKLHLNFLNAMVQDMGQKKALIWIMSEHPVSEINEFRKKYGNIQAPIEGKKTDTRPGLYAFGPKVGPFVSNLNGIHDVTVDKWMTRTFNRYFGTMIGPDGNIIDAPTEPQRKAIKNLVNEVADRANIKPYQVQSLLWFYEQKLFTKLGVPSPSYAFSDGSRKFTEEGRDRGGETGVSGIAEQPEKLSLNKTLGLTDERINRLIDNYIYTQNDAEEKTKAYIALVDPKEFLSATVSPEYKETLESENKPLDIEKLTAEKAPIYLSVKPTEGKKHELSIRGHEGRHRMMALRDAGFKNVPVVFEFSSGENRKPIDDLYIHAQKFNEGRQGSSGFVAYDLLPINYKYKDEVKERFTEGDVRYSLRKAPDTPAFKRWFGDSKVVDADGQPKVMYHGLAKDTTDFTRKTARGAPIFLTDDPEFAQRFSADSYLQVAAHPEKYVTKEQLKDGEKKAIAAIRKDYGKDILGKEMIDSIRDGNPVAEAREYLQKEYVNMLPAGPHIMPLYVRAERPFDYQNSRHINRLKEEVELTNDMWRSVREGDWDIIESQEVQDAIQMAGFDSFYVKEHGYKNLAVYEPNQVKSATGNIGTFDVTNPDIRYSLRSTRQPPESKEFKNWFTGSYFTSKGEPLVMYHGTARDITIFKGKQAKAIFVTTEPDVAHTYADMGVDYMRTEAYKALTRDEKVELITTVAEQAERDGTIDRQELKEITSELKKRVPPIDTEKNRILDLPYQIKGEIIESLNNLLPTKGNIMPVYVNAKNIFDYANKDDVNKVIDWMTNNSSYLGHMQNPERWLSSVKGIISRGNWPRIESPEIQEAIRALGFDGFSVLEAGTKNYAVYNPTAIKSVTGNIGTFGLGEVSTEQAARFGMTPEQARKAQEEGDIRFSLRAATPAHINDTIDKTTYAREEKGFVERLMNAIAPESWTDLRAKSLHRYEAMGPADKAYAKKMGGTALLADESAESAALMSDLAAGVTASALGVHDRHGGAPVFRNGITTIDSSIKGPVAIFAPLAKYGDPRIYQMWQSYAGVKRARRFFKEGREQNYTQADMQNAEQLARIYPEFKQIFDDWNKFNDALVKYQVDTGVLSKERADEYRKYSDYIPFYRQLEGEQTIGPKIFQSISGVKTTKKLKGSEAPIADLMETIVRNVQSGIQSGMKNIAAQRAIKVFEGIGEAVPTHATNNGPAVVYALYNGEKKAFEVADHGLYNSMQSLNLPDLPFLGFFAGPANLLRNLVTKDPGFMLANMVRDSMSAWVTSGVKMTPIASAIKNFTGALRGTSPEYQALLNAGILGGYEFSQNVEASGKQLYKELAKYGPSTSLGKIKKPFTSLWEALEKGTTASDAATRMEVYKNVLAETGNEAEALFRALEVMNFNRKGSSAVVRIMTAAIPFLNARIQGLDVLYRAAFGKMATQDAKAIQKSFFIRGATIMALSMMYWALTHDDDDYKKQEQETRDNNWLLPSLGIKIPIPFEVGVIFKVIPERIAEYAFGTDTGKDFADSMKRNLMSTFAFNPIPQVVLPLVEARTNYSFFTGRSIIGQGLEGVAPEFQVGPNTSRLAKWLGSVTGQSPMMIDHIVGGYTGTFGMYVADAIDSIVSSNSDVPKASKRFEQMPVLRRFLLDPEARGNVTAYYDLKNSTDEAVRTSNFLERTMNFEDLSQYNQDAVKMLATADLVKSMDKDMKELNNFMVQIRSSPIDSDEKRDLLRAINQAQNNMVANIKLIKKSMD